MNAHLAPIAELDPEYVKREQRREFRFWASLAVAIAAIAGATFAIVVNARQDTKITQIQHSACQVDPAGAECQQTKRAASRAADLYTTCIPFFKAGYPCPKPGSRAAERQLQAKSKEVQNLELGDADSQAPPAPSNSHVGTHKGTSPELKQPPKAGEPQHEAESEAPPVDTEVGTTHAESAPEVAVEVPPSANPPVTSEGQKPLVPLVPVIEAVCTSADRLAHLC